ncbi:hypothetical protein ACFL59_10200 [Planctomycetota bacterium]
MKRLFLAPFRLKGAVLKGAELEVHAITPAEPPKREPPEEDADSEADDDAEEEEGLVEPEDDTERTWYLMECTITPSEPTGQFTRWEPDELLLVDFDRVVNEDTDLDDDSCRVSEVKVLGPGDIDEEHAKFEGPLRLSLHLGTKAGAKRLKVQYYFETFGDVQLPQHSLGANG